MFDLIIIGAGPGGYHLAEKAAKEGKKVAIIEKEKFGGTCVNVGCIPSKAFLHVEKVVNEANESAFMGIVSKQKVTIDQKKVVAYKDEKVAFLSAGARAGVKKAGAKIYEGYGTILKTTEKGQFQVKINDEILIGQNLIIATGSNVFVPPIEGVKEAHQKGRAITSTEALSLTEIPKELVVIGAGVIGLELGSYFAGVGSKVTIVELGPKIAGNTDKEISASLQKALENKGITFILNSSVKAVSKHNCLIVDKDQKETTITFDKLLVAAGRKPYIKNLGIENINLYIERGVIVVDEYLQTNVPGVYAIGDVNGKLMLAHTAFREAEVVLDNLNGIKTTINYNKIPVVIYGTPEVAEIGITEDNAKKQNIDVEIKKLSMLYSGRFVIEESKFDGLIKVIIKKDNQEIIGMSIFGSYASEIIIAGSILIGKRFSKDQLKEVVFAHPTVGEIIKDCVFN